MVIRRNDSFSHYNRLEAIYIYRTSFLHSYNSQDTYYPLVKDEYCDGLEGKPRSGRTPTVTKTEGIGEAKSDELKSSGKECMAFID